jgi:hypothetical protein
MMRWVGRVACMEMWNSYKTLVGKPEVKRQLGGPSRKGKDNTLKEKVCEDWIHLAHDGAQVRLFVNT